MKKLLILVALPLFLLQSCKNNEKSDLKNELDSVSYAIGSNIGKKIKADKIPLLDKDAFYSGLKDAYDSSKLVIDEEKGQELLNNFFKKSQEKANEPRIKKEKEFLAKNKTRKEVITMPSGLQYEVIKEGTGVKPVASDVVTINYKGTFLDGKVFDSSYDRKEAAVFPVEQLIPGWQEALLLMPVGSKWKIYVPYDLAYGEMGMPPHIQPYSMLIFEMELLKTEVNKQPKQQTQLTPEQLEEMKKKIGK